MADVFLSYARANEAPAGRVARELGKAGLSVWFDRELPAHQAYADVIAAELESAAAVLVLWSAAAVESQWVRSEANRARELGRLVQTRLDDCRLPMPFDQIQCADLRAWRGGAGHAGWSQVLRSIKALGPNKGEAVTAANKEQAPSLNRRAVLVGGSAAALAAAGAVGFFAWRSFDRPRMSPQAQLLLERGFAALQDNDALDPQGPGSTMQAIALLTAATDAAPEAATAWGALAMAYAVRKRVAPLTERAGLDMRSRSAATRALELDHNEARALGALRLIEPVYRNWLAAERDDRKAFERNPKLPILRFVLSDLLGNVGRWSDAASFSRRFDRQHWLIPGADRKVLVDLWSSGDLQGADKALSVAVQHWPQHPQIWRTRVAYLMFSGRPDDALQLLREGAERPLEISDDLVEAMRATAEALAGTRPPAEAIARNLDYVKRHPDAALPVAQVAAALGSADAVFSILEGYYFGTGEWARTAPAGGDQDRVTNRLFQPPMRSIWQEPRFETLLRRIGLEDYWRQSRTVPDFRRR